MICYLIHIVKIRVFKVSVFAPDFYSAVYSDRGKKPYMFTQFGEKYRKWARVTKATMRIQHKPGDAIEVDWAGDTIPIFDSVTGEQSKAYLFVAVLPCSYFAYAEVCGVSAQ